MSWNENTRVWMRRAVVDRHPVASMISMTSMVSMVRMARWAGRGGGMDWGGGIDCTLVLWEMLRMSGMRPWRAGE